MQIKTQQFPKAAAQALASDQIQRALARVSEGFDGARQRAIKELSTEVWERYREQGRQVKEHAIEHLDYYLGLLADNVQRNGGVVHFARDSKEATDVVIDIARSRGVKLAVKSKSMVSEEMALNHALEAQGIESVETDLGEYIIQLADETPFHIVAPAIHKSKEEVAQLFSEKLGVRRFTSISALTSVARRTLRQTFL